MLAAGKNCHSVTHCLCHLYIGCRRDLSFCYTLSVTYHNYYYVGCRSDLSFCHTLSVTYMLAAGETCHSVTHCLCHLYVGCRRDLSFCHTLSLSLICWLQERPVILSHTVSVIYMLAAGETCHFVTHCLCHLYVGCIFTYMLTALRHMSGRNTLPYISPTICLQLGLIYTDSCPSSGVPGCLLKPLSETISFNCNFFRNHQKILG